MRGSLAIVCMMLFLGSAFAQEQELNFFLEPIRYHYTTGETYVQIIIAVDGTSIQYEREQDDLFQASVGIDITISRLTDDNDTSKIYHDKYNLGLATADRIADTTLLSRRVMLRNTNEIGLSEGRYVIQAIANDNFAPKSSPIVSFSEIVVTRLPREEVGFSDIKFLAGELPYPTQLEKGSHWPDRRDFLIPLGTNNNLFNQDTLSFFVEFYNSDKLFDGNFFVRSRIMIEDRILFAYEEVQNKSPRPLNMIKEKFDISKLKSNIYTLMVELVDNKNNVKSSTSCKFFLWNSRVDSDFDAFTVTNPETDIFSNYSEDELNSYLQTLTYISSQEERNFIGVLANADQKRNYLASFWEKRRRYPTQPIEALWQGHLAALTYCNQEFKSALRKGWQTDRGRVFMKYGIPSNIERFPYEANLVPYEIWYYDRLSVQTKVKFIFYDKDLSTNEYELLHSDKYGEVNNPNWRQQLMSRGNVPGNIDFEDNTNYDTKLNPND